MRCPSCNKQSSGKTPVCPSCGADLDLGRVTDELIDRVIDGRYRILERISEGGMGRVYRANQLALDHEIAIKVIRPDLASNREVARRFFREAKVAAMLSHPNCVNIIDFGEADGTLYLAMELLRGMPLDVVLTTSGPISPSRTVDIAVQVLDVLDAAHRLSIVHRDLKPENILVQQTPGRADFVKVVDFGIAKITDPLRSDGQALTQTGTIVGTPAYMSPEQVLGRPVDVRSDVYSLGVVCFEMLAQRTPFSGNIGELLRAHLTEAAPPLATLRPEIPAALAEIIDRMLAKEPELRPAIAPELSQELRASLDGSVPEVAAESDDRFAGLRRHLPAAVVDAVAAVDIADDRTRRELVVVMLELSANDPRAVSLVTEVTDALARIVENSGGVLEYRDDGSARITYGVERSLADVVERAVRAAVEMRDEIARQVALTGVDFALTCAVHLAPAMISNDGSVEPIGDLYELPARLLANGGVNQVVASDAVGSRLGDWCRSQRLAPDRHEILAIYDPSQPIQTIRQPLVGRDDDIAELIAMARRDGIIDLDGELGIGKSRVLGALKAPLTEAGFVCLEAAGPRIVKELVRGLERHGLDSCGLRPDQLELVRRWRAGSLSTSGHELDVAVADTVRDALIGFATGRSVALLLDNLERARSVSVELVRQLAAAPANLVVIAASRTGHRRPWHGLEPSPGVDVKTLGPLDGRAIEAMLEGMFAAAARVIGLKAGAAPTAVPQWIRSLVSTRAGGSPLMAVELVGALIDAGAVGRGADGGWQLATAPIEVPLARNFATLIAQRLDALDANQRDVCAALAVAGTSLERDELAGLLDRPIAGDLERLVARQLLSSAGGEISFAASSAAEVVLELLGDAEKQRWHLALASQLAGSGRGDPEAVADHYAAAGAWDQAIEQLERAASAASARDRAAEIWTRATEAAARLHRDRRDQASARQLCRLGLRAAEIWRSVGDLNRLRQITAQLVDTVGDTGEPTTVARVDRMRAQLALATGDLEKALQVLDDVIAAALAHRDGSLYAEAHADLGEVYEKRGDLESATDCMVRSLELAQRGSSDDVRRLSLRVLLALGRVLLRRRKASQAFELLEQALGLARELHDPSSEARALGNLAAAYHTTNDPERAIESARASLDVSRRCGDHIGAARQLNNLGTLHIAAGDLDSASTCFDEAYESAQRLGWREGMASAAAGRDQVRAKGARGRHH